MACRRLTAEEYKNLPEGATAYEKESDCQCCTEQDLSRCYYCVDQLVRSGNEPFQCSEAPFGIVDPASGMCYAAIPVPDYDPAAGPVENRDFCYNIFRSKLTDPWYSGMSGSQPVQGTCCDTDCCPFRFS